MSKEEAEKIIRSWIEHKMLWYTNSSIYNQAEISNAIDVLGKEETEKIITEVTILWKD